jgi:hypothetical protein
VGGNQQGGVARELGNVDWHGWYRGNGHTPVVFVGDSYTFTCAPKQTGDVAVSGTALCVGIEIVADQRDPDNPVPIYHTVHFAAAGALSTGETAPEDSSTTVVYPPKGLCAYFGTSQARTKYQRLWMYDRAPARTVDCTSDGQIIWAAGELDATFEWIVNTDDSSDFPSVSADDQTTRMYVTAATYWELNWMYITDAPDPWEANRRQPKVVDAKFAAAFNGHSGTTVGHINNPAEDTKWPPS